MGVFRGIAELAGVPTPAMDESLTWGPVGSPFS